MILHRRTNPPKYSEYGRYKPILREDFCYRCGHCRTHESAFGSVRNMAIDHFRPQSRFPWLISDYPNLYYCCNECNTYKADRWPSDDELSDDLRFVDPCVEDPDDHYEFVDSEIKPRTRPGRFTITVLRLDRPTLLARRRALAARRADVVLNLKRLHRIRESAANDLDVLEEVDAVREHLLDQLRLLDSPPKLEA